MTIATTRFVRRSFTSLLLTFPFVVSAQQSRVSYTMAGAPILQRLTTSITYEDAAACELHRVNAMVFQSDGSLIISNSGNQQLCIYAADGKFVRTAGRKGAGPGEYAFIDGVDRLAADSIAVSDGVSRRLSILAPNGTFVRSFRLDPPETSLGSLSFMQALKGGTIVLAYSTVQTALPQPTAMIFQSRLFRVNSNGADAKALGTINTSEHFVQRAPANRGGTSYYSLAFGNVTAAARMNDGYIVSEGGTPEIDEMTTDGKTRVTHDFVMPLRPVTDKHMNDWRAEATRPPAHPDRYYDPTSDKNLAAEMPFPKNFPSLRAVMTDEGKIIWAERYPLPEDKGSTWFRLDPSTKRITNFTFPSKFKAMAVHNGKVCGIGLDSDDVQGIRCWVAK